MAEPMFIHWVQGDQFYEVDRPVDNTPDAYRCWMGTGSTAVLHSYRGWSLVSYEAMVVGRMRGAAVFMKPEDTDGT